MQELWQVEAQEVQRRIGTGRDSRRLHFGKSSRRFFIADLTRSRLSWMAVSGNPTIVNPVIAVGL